MPTYTLEREGKSVTVESPRELTHAELAQVSATSLPQEAPLRWRDVPGALMDTLSDKPLGGAKDPHTIRRPTDVLWNPQNLTERLVGSAVTAPLIATGGAATGALAKGAPALVKAVAPAAGRVATQGGLSKAKGEDWPHTFVDMAGAVLGEGVGAGIGKIAGKIAGPAAREGVRQAEAARVGKAGGDIFPELEAANDKELWGAAQQWGKKAVERAFQPAINEIDTKLGGARTLLLPSVSNKPISFASAVKAMFEAEKDTRRTIRFELQGALAKINPTLAQDFAAAMETRGAAYALLGALKKGMDPSGKLDPVKVAKYVNANTDKLQNYAGRYWPQIESALLGAGKTAPVDIPAKAEATKILGHTLKVPMGVSQFGQKVEQAAQSNAGRSLVDAALGTPPFGAVAMGAAANLPRKVIRRVPGGSYIDDLIAEEADDPSGH